MAKTPEQELAEFEALMNSLEQMHSAPVATKKDDLQELANFEKELANSKGISTISTPRKELSISEVEPIKYPEIGTAAKSALYGLTGELIPTVVGIAGAADLGLPLKEGYIAARDIVGEPLREAAKQEPGIAQSAEIAGLVGAGAAGLGGLAALRQLGLKEAAKRTAAVLPKAAAAGAIEQVAAAPVETGELMTPEQIAEQAVVGSALGTLLSPLGVSKTPVIEPVVKKIPDVKLTRTSAGETATIPVTNEGMRAANVDVERLTRTRQKPMKDIFEYENEIPPQILPPEGVKFKPEVVQPISIQTAPDSIKSGKETLVKQARSLIQNKKEAGDIRDITFENGKLVDQNGTPITVYKGSQYDLNVQGDIRDINYFTDNPYVATTFANKGYFTKANLEQIVNPFIYDANGAVFDSIPVMTQNGVRYVDADTIVKKAKEAGHDAVVIKNVLALRGKADPFKQGPIKPENTLNSFIVAFDQKQVSNPDTKKIQEILDKYTSAEELISSEQKPRSLSAGADISSPREEIDGSGQLLLFPRSQMRSVAPVPPQLQAFAEAGIPPDWKPTREFLESNLKLLEGRLNRVRNKASKAEIAELKQNIQLTKDEIAALKPAEQLELPLKAPKLSPMRMRTKTPLVTVEDLNALQRQGIELRKNIATVVEAINKNPDNELLNLQLDELNKQYKALVEQAGTKAEQYNKPSNVAFDDKHRALIDRVEKLKSDVAAQETLIADAKAAGKKAPSGSVKKLGMLERELEVQQNKLDNYKPKLPGYVVKGPVSEMRKKAEGASPGGGLPFQFTQDTPYKRGVAEREQQSKLVDAIDYELGALEQAGKTNTKEYRKLERESIDADNKLYKLMLEYRDPGEFVKDYDLYNKEYNRVLNNVPHGVPGTDIYELRVQTRAVDLENAFNNRQDVVNEFLEIAKKHPDIFEFLPPQHPLNELRSKIQTTGIVDRLRNLLGKKKGGGGTGGEGGSGGLPPGGTPPQLPPAGGSQLQKAFGKAVVAPKERTPFSNAGNSPEQLFKQLEKYFKQGEARKPRAEGGEEYEASVIKYERGGSPPPIGLDEKIKEMDLPRVYPRLESEIIQLENGIAAAKEELRQVTAVFKSTTDPEIKNAVGINKKKLEEFVNNLNTQLAERKIQHIYMQRPDWLEEITLDSYGKAVKSPKVFIDWEPKYNTLKIKDMTDGQNGELYHIIGSVRPNGSMDMNIYTVDWSIDPDKLTGKRPRSRMFTGKELMQYFMYFHRNTVKSISDLYVEGNNEMFNEAYNRAYPGLRKQFPKSIAQQLALREAAAGTFSGQQHLSRGFDIKEVTADLERGGKIYGPSVQYDIRPRGGSGGKK